MSTVDEGRPETDWLPGNPTRRRLWRVARWTAVAVAFVAAAAIPEAGGDHDLVNVAVALVAFSFSFWAGSRERRYAPRLRIAGDELLRSEGRILDASGRSLASVSLVMDDHALHLLGRGAKVDNDAIRYEDIACAQHLRRAVGHGASDVVFFVEGNGKSYPIATTEPDRIVGVLDANGVEIHEPIDADTATWSKAFDPDRHATCRGVEPGSVRVATSTVDRTAERRVRRRRVLRVALWSSLVLVVLVGALAFYAGVIADDPNESASQDEVDTAAARATRALDRWELPATVIRAPVEDRARAYGYGGIEVVRHFMPAPGVTAEQAAMDLVAALRAQGYHLPQDFVDPNSWGDDGNCRLRGYPDCLLVIELVGADHDRIDATFLPT